MPLPVRRIETSSRPMLTARVPKTEKARPRRIDVKTD